MDELTILYTTANKIPEPFGANVRNLLAQSAKQYPIISLSKEPLDFGTNILDSGESVSFLGEYKALLEGAKAATTPFIAICEDDTLYPDEHFNYRPPMDTFAYNFTRWNLYTWSDPPFFSLRQRKILATLIVSRELFIETIEERFAKHPKDVPLQWWGEPGRNDYEKRLGVTECKSLEFNTYNPVVVISHPDSFGYESTGTHKQSNRIRALELPYWGTAEKVMRLYHV